MNKFWTRYNFFMMGFFAFAIVANVLNAMFFSGHDNETIQTLAINFVGLCLVDGSLIWLHYVFNSEKKRPRSLVQWGLTISNVVVAGLNILLMARVYNLIN